MFRLINWSLCHMHVMDYFASLGTFMHQGRRRQIGNKITAHVLINFVCRASNNPKGLLAVPSVSLREEGRIKDWKLHVKLIMDKLAYFLVLDSLGYRHFDSEIIEWNNKEQNNVKIYIYISLNTIVNYILLLLTKQNNILSTELQQS